MTICGPRSGASGETSSEAEDGNCDTRQFLQLYGQLQPEAPALFANCEENSSVHSGDLPPGTKLIFEVKVEVNPGTGEYRRILEQAHRCGFRQLEPGTRNGCVVLAASGPGWAKVFEDEAFTAHEPSIASITDHSSSDRSIKIAEIEEWRAGVGTRSEFFGDAKQRLRSLHFRLVSDIARLAFSGDMGEEDPIHYPADLGLDG